ncbi:MAG: lipocalin-like domain-containing protein [Vicinamibacteria bacterium]
MSGARIVAAALLTGQAACSPAPPAGAGSDPPTESLELAGAETVAFARAHEPRAFVLPEDHGPHFDYQTEWWYYTGQLESEAAERFGYQLTIFRRGLAPGAPPRGPGLATNQIYFAHLALTDAQRRTHQAFERWSRGAAGLAGASGSPFAVHLGDWSVRATDGEGRQLRLEAREGPLELELSLRATKRLVAHGDRGLSAKSEEPGNASYYVGYTRMATEGRLLLAGRARTVRGESWFDHEWSTSALGPQAVGWDWFSLQLDDGRELMYFQIRRKDGGIEPVSGGTLVSATGGARRLSADELRLSHAGVWTSVKSGARYPARWRLALPSEGLDLEIEPLVPDQELGLSFTYWEGAVGVSGRSGERPIGGRGYVELTGYAATMQGVF